MRRDTPPWVISYCQTWGRQKRRIWDGSETFVNCEGKEDTHIDGYAGSLLGRIREERDGAGQQGALHQHWAEVMWGHGLEVQRSLPGMPENPLLVGHLQYVWPKEFGLSIPRKAALIELDKNQYWDSLRNFEWWVFARLNPASDCQPSKLPLQLVSKPPTVRPNPVGLPKVSLNLASLNRPKITLKYADPEEAA